MASANVQKLVSIRDSLQNFYSLSGLTQQPAVLEELRAMDVEEGPTEQVQVQEERDNDSNRGQIIMIQEALRKELAAKHLRKHGTEDLVEDGTEVAMQLTQNKDGDEEAERIMSDHESDDAIMKEMDFVPTPGGIAAVPKASDCMEMDHGVSDVSPHKPLRRRSQRLCRKRRISDTDFDTKSSAKKEGGNKRRKVESNVGDHAHIQSVAMEHTDTRSLSLTEDVNDLDGTDGAVMETSIDGKIAGHHEPVELESEIVMTPPPTEQRADENPDHSVPASFQFEIPSMDEAVDAANEEAMRFEKEMQTTPSKVSEEMSQCDRNGDETMTESVVVKHSGQPSTGVILSDAGDSNVNVVDRGLSLNEGQIQDSLQRLNAMEDSLMEDNILILDDQATALRNSEHVTPEMVAECRAMLDLFGIPYITSPSEAEAQCGMLEMLGLVDGVITDGMC